MISIANVHTGCLLIPKLEFHSESKFNKIFSQFIPGIPDISAATISGKRAVTSLESEKPFADILTEMS